MFEIKLTLGKSLYSLIKYQNLGFSSKDDDKIKEVKKIRMWQKRIDQFDKLLAFSKKDIKYDLLSKALEIITEMGSSIVILGLIFIISVINDLKLLFLFLPIYIFQVILVEIVKLTFRRARPNSHVNTNILGIKSTSGSFPSGHTSNMFCFGYLFCNYFQTNIFITTLIFLVAANIGLSRILLGKHYLIDVLAGALIGLSLAILGTYAWIHIYSYTTLIPRIG